jgi:voltage-gated potassium channel Kch
VIGDAANTHVLERAGLDAARVLVVCLPERMSVRRVVDYARRIHPRLEIVARTHSERERLDLLRAGVDEAVLGELELGLELGRHALRSAGVDAAATQACVDARRRRAQDSER